MPNLTRQMIDIMHNLQKQCRKNVNIRNAIAIPCISVIPVYITQKTKVEVFMLYLQFFVISLCVDIAT